MFFVVHVPFHEKKMASVLQHIIADDGSLKSHTAHSYLNSYKFASHETGKWPISTRRDDATARRMQCRQAPTGPWCGSTARYVITVCATKAFYDRTNHFCTTESLRVRQHQEQEPQHVRRRAGHADLERIGASVAALGYNTLAERVEGLLLLRTN